MKSKALLAMMVALLSVFTARHAYAQTAFASASVTILPADPTLRPVPPAGFGVSYNSEAVARSQASAPKNHKRSFSPHLKELPEGVVLRQPAGSIYNAHVLRAKKRTEKPGIQRLTPDAIVALE